MNHRTLLNLVVAAGLLLVALALIAALVVCREADLRGHLVVLLGTDIGALAGVLRGNDHQAPAPPERKPDADSR